MNGQELLLVGAGGFLGAISRYLVDQGVTRWLATTLPWGTFVVNISGSFLLGVLAAVVMERGVLPASVRPAVLIGFIGAYTTFSTLMLESWRLVETGSAGLALLNLGGSVLLGMTAVVAGLALGRAVF